MADQEQAANQQNPTSSNNDNAPSKTDMPLFYKSVSVLDPGRHADVGLSRSRNFGFAAKANSAPLNGVEFRMAATNYPIVFTGAAPYLPMAIFSGRQEENLFVSDQGIWRQNHYIPAYVRRYPFIFVANEEAESLTLCIDDASEMVIKNGEENRLFENGEASDVVKRALEFCRIFQGHFQLTVEFTKALEESGLLVNRAVDLKLSSGDTLKVGGFKLVDENKMTELSDETVALWHKKGWLALIYWHIVSQNNWNELTHAIDASK
ncbi:MAG: SapC family protein [Magnetococcales bacterium]|nr:SapC family protein [Magnetococcales bacterium]